MSNANNDNISLWISDLLNCISEPDARDFCQDFFQRLEDLHHRYANHVVRIGVVGVTSSGKSSLLNAILGTKLLPTGVPPSSGRQVVCAFNRHTYAEVLFNEDTKKPTLKIAANIPNVILHFGDERENPKNRLGVREIHCFASAWRLPYNFILVDTPGLAAYGHEEHEEITMRLVVPTVDAILYLTTAKCESDARTLSYIDSMTAQDKPLIIVQNKIDTVEEKLTRNLSNSKSKEQIQREHLDRVRAMLQKAQKESVRTAPIIQVSARSGLGIKELLDAIVKQVEFNIESRKWRFAQQFLGILKELQEKASVFLSQGKEKELKLTEIRNRAALFTSHHVLMQSKYNQFCDSIHSKLEDVRGLAANIIGAVCNGYKLPLPTDMPTTEIRQRTITFYASKSELPKELKSAKDELESKLKEVVSYLNHAIKDTNDLLSSSARELNLQENQLIRPMLLAPRPIASIPDAVEFKTVHHKPQQREQIGFWGWLKRKADVFDNGWGYDDIPGWDEEVRKFKPQEFLSGIIKATGDCTAFMSSSSEKFIENTEYAISVLGDRLAELDRELQTLRADSTNISEAMLARLEQSTADYIMQVKKVYGNEMPINNLTQPDLPVEEKPLQEHTCPELLYRLYEFAHNESFLLNAAWLKSIVRRVGAAKPRIQVLGWNEQELEKFRNNYFQANSEYDSSPDFLNVANPKVFPSRASKPAMIFVLLELSESGYTEKQFVETGIRDYLRENSDIPIVWCMCSASGLHNSLIEAFAELIRIAKTAIGNKQPFEFMTNDRNLYYSALLHELYFDTNHCVSEDDRRNFVHDFDTIFRLNAAGRNSTGIFLNEFLKLKRSPHHG